MPKVKAFYEAIHESRAGSFLIESTVGLGIGVATGEFYGAVGWEHAPEPEI